MTRNGILTVWLAIASVTVSSSLAHAATPLFRAGEVIVKLKTNSKKSKSTLGSQTHALFGELGQKYAVSVTPFDTDKRYVKVVVKDNVGMQQLLADIQKSPYIEYAEPNYVLHAFGVNAITPNDQNFGLDWGLLNVGQVDKKGQAGTAGVDIGATKAWATGTGSRSVVVAVIDTGVDYTHEDLKDNIFVNKN